MAEATACLTPRRRPTLEKALPVAALLLALSLPGSARANTGIVVSPDGHVLTAYHVVRSCARIAVGKGVAALPLAFDQEHDLALLETSAPEKNIALFRASPDFGVGYRVTVAGFPLKDWSSPVPKLTSGIVTSLGEGALKARDDDYRESIRFTAPVVSGISGGPVLDGAGDLVGMAVAVVTMRRATDDQPLSLRLGIGVARHRLLSFLDTHKVPYRTAARGEALSDADIAKKARSFTVRIRCSR